MYEDFGNRSKSRQFCRRTTTQGGATTNRGGKIHFLNLYLIPFLIAVYFHFLLFNLSKLLLLFLLFLYIIFIILVYTFLFFLFYFFLFFFPLLLTLYLCFDFAG
jgi:hypothetical protein